MARLAISREREDDDEQNRAYSTGKHVGAAGGTLLGPDHLACRTVDRGRGGIELALQRPPAGAAVTLGDGFVGLIDELWVGGHGLRQGDLWDIDPNAACPQGLTCREEVIDLIPDGFSHRVPLPMKSVVDPAACGPGSPCPLLLIISGGGTCADNYAPRGTVEYYARDGFIAVTVDPYCESDKELHSYPAEIGLDLRHIARRPAGAQAHLSCGGSYSPYR